MAKRLGKRAFRGKKGEQFVRSWATEMECVTLLAEENMPSIDGQIQLYDSESDSNLYIAYQVKSGRSYVRVYKPNPRYLRLRLGSKDIANWKKSNVPTIVIWVSDDDLPKRYALWGEAERARPQEGYLKISRKCLLDATAVPRFLDIARTHAGIPSIPILRKSTLFPSCVSEVKDKARKFYSEWRKQGSISPVFGKVDITLRAWRHITRVSSSQREVCHKLSLLAFAKEVIESSTKSRFLRSFDVKSTLLRKSFNVDQSPLRYSFPVHRDVKKELHAVCGLHKSGFRSDMTIEVVLEVYKIGRRVIRARLYGVHEKRR